MLSYRTKLVSVFVGHVESMFGIALRAGLLAKLKPANGLPPSGLPSLMRGATKGIGKNCENTLVPLARGGRQGRLRRLWPRNMRSGTNAGLPDAPLSCLALRGPRVAAPKE